jgi:adenylate cyclase
MVEGQLDPQTLPASVLFTDITNFTTYAARASAGELTEALQRYFTAITEVVLNHDGWVDKFIGDSVMALFGVPGGSTEHAHQAVRAASEMDRVMATLGLPWKHRVGIATGRVVAGDIGSRQKPTYTAIGDPVNLASRLTGIARPGEVLVCPDTYADVVTAGFRFEALGELDVRGYGAAPVFRLLSQS